MKIACLGGGPAGLYFAISMKRRDAAHDVTVYERNRPDDTFGWGVVLSDETLENLAANDPASAEAIRAHFAYWDDIAVHYRGARTVSTGHGFCGIGRKQLLNLLQQRALALGVTLRFETEIDGFQADQSRIFITGSGGNGMSKYLGGFSDTAEYVGKFVKQLKGDEYVPALERCRDQFNGIDIDRLRVKPIVKITGELWAQTTEGDGNFNMFNFLQREGAQVLVEPIGTWIMYMIHQVIQKYKDFKGLEEGAVLPPIWKVGTRAKIEFGFRQKVAKLKLAEAIFIASARVSASSSSGATTRLIRPFASASWAEIG